jgi:hypothetical protein
VEVRHGEVEDPTVEEVEEVEEEERAEGLVLGGGGGAARSREMIEESDDLGGAEPARVAAGVEGDEGADPGDVRLLGARGVVEAAEGGADGFEEGHSTWISRPHCAVDGWPRHREHETA